MNASQNPIETKRYDPQNAELHLRKFCFPRTSANSWATTIENANPENVLKNSAPVTQKPFVGASCPFHNPWTQDEQRHSILTMGCRIIQHLSPSSHTISKHHDLLKCRGTCCVSHAHEAILVVPKWPTQKCLSKGSDTADTPLTTDLVIWRQFTHQIFLISPAFSPSMRDEDITAESFGMLHQSIAHTTRLQCHGFPWEKLPRQEKGETSGKNVEKGDT